MKSLFTIISMVFLFSSCANNSVKYLELELKEMKRKLASLEENKVKKEKEKKKREKLYFNHNCIPSYKSHQNNKSKYIIINGRGDTFEEAAKDMRIKVPNLFQNTKIESRTSKYSTNKFYNESQSLSYNHGAFIEEYHTYYCKYRGEFWATAVIPKDGIRYLSKLDTPKDKLLLNIDKMKKFCKKRGFHHTTLVLDNSSNKIKANYIKYFKREFALICGPFRVVIESNIRAMDEYNDTYDGRHNNLKEFSAVKIHWLKIEDWTLEFKLEMERLKRIGKK
jgi:hypothetical protein